MNWLGLGVKGYEKDDVAKSMVWLAKIIFRIFSLFTFLGDIWSEHIKMS